MRNVFVGAGCKKYKSPDSHWCKGGPVRVGELVEESRVVAEQAEDRDDQAEEEGRRRWRERAKFFEGREKTFK